MASSELRESEPEVDPHMALIPPGTPFSKIRPPKVRDKNWAMARIDNAHRRKILHHFPKAKFDTQFVVGLPSYEWAEYIETKMQAGMKWEDYGMKWQLVCIKRASELNVQTPEGFYSYFRYDNFVPKWTGWKGFVTDPDGASPLDRDGEQV